MSDSRSKGSNGQSQTQVGKTPLEAIGASSSIVVSAHLGQPVDVAQEPMTGPTLSDPSALSPFRLQALRILDRAWGAGWTLSPAPPRRQWMDQHTHAYHCLPLVVANQWGWHITFPTRVRAIWDGSAGLGGLKVEVDSQYEVAVKSQFGQGILTFSPPWVFRTPPGWDLYAKGPANLWKPNATPLEGIIETWWLPYTFTFNWKLIEAGEVVFEPGECIGMIIPVPHQTFDSAEALEESIFAEPDIEAQLREWRDERRKRAGQAEAKHLRYRKAQDIDGHLTRVPVPPVRLGRLGPLPPSSSPYDEQSRPRRS